MTPDTIFILIIVIFSAIIHEVMHGVAADKLGDPTARYAGRLTLNPIPHIDLFGSIILPVMLALSNASFFFAWAKPVPYNPYNLRRDGLFARFSEGIVAFAGPLSNIVIALFSAFVIRLHLLGAGVDGALFLVVAVNVMLFLFNMIPIPPLDGSKVLESLLPRALQHGYGRWRHSIESQPFIGMGIMILFVLVLGNEFSTVIYKIASALVGV